MIKNHAKLVQMLTLSLMIMSFGVSFDAFWHLTRGRETFWALPHLFIYSGATLGIYFSWLGHRFVKSSGWTWLFRTLLLIPLSAPLDELWHQFRGKESVDSLLILWSPPHALLFLSAMFAVLCASVMVAHTERLKNKNLLGSVLLGLFLNFAGIFAGPFYPTTPISILGASGLGIIGGLMVITFLLARKMFNEPGSASLTAGITVLLVMMMLDANYYMSADINFFHHPDWNLMLIYLLPAFIIDLTDNWYSPSRGMLAGIAIGLLFFGLGAFAPGSPFVYSDLWFGTIAAALGGIFAGAIFEHLLPDKKTA